MTSRRNMLGTLAASAMLGASSGRTMAAQADLSDGNGSSDARSLGITGSPTDAAAWHRLASRSDTMPCSIRLPMGRYPVNGIALPRAGAVTADPGAVMVRDGTAGAMLTVPADGAGVQSTHALLLTGLTIDAAMGDRRLGDGMVVGNHANATFRDITVRNAANGIRIDAGQFLLMDRLKVQDNDVGLYCRPAKAAGGANSLTLVHPLFVNNTVGLFLDNGGNTYGQGDIVLLNPQFLANSHCAIAVIGLSARLRSQLYVTGFAPEANGQAVAGAPAIRRINDRNVPRCSLYARFGTVSLSDGGFAEYASTDPCVILEQSTLSLHNIEGYGGPGGVSVAADAGSDVVISGGYGLIGVCHGVASFEGALAPGASQGALVGPLRRRSASHIANHFAVPEIGDFRPLPGVAANVRADLRGKFQHASFAPYVGSSESNALRLVIPQGRAERLFARVEMEADRDCRIRIATYPNDGALIVTLRKHEPTLVCYWVNDAPNPAGLIAFSPADERAPAIAFRNVQTIGGSLGDPQFRADCNTLCAGGYNAADTKV